MLWLPPLAYREVQDNLPASGGAIGANVTASATIHTKGAWTQLLAATNFEAEWLVVVPSNVSVAATQTDLLLDIGIGGAGSEQVLIPDILSGWTPNHDAGAARMFSAPIYVPKGSRISARAQALIASDVVTVGVWLYGGARQPAMPTFSRVDAIGINAAASQGTSVTPGASNAFGSWTSVGSTTARPYKGLVFLPQGMLADTNVTGAVFQFQVGYGSTQIGPTYHVTSSSVERIMGPIPAMPIFHPIPSGTQLQVRAKSNIAGPEPIDVALYGLS